MLKQSTLLLFACVAVLGPARAAEALFVEDFDDLNDESVTTSNTSLGFVRVVGNGAAAAGVPAFSDGSSWLSILGDGVASVGKPTGSYTAFDVGTFSFSLHTPTDFAGSDFVFSTGTGGYYSFGSSSLGTATGFDQYTAALRVSSTGLLQTCTPSATNGSNWQTIATLTADTTYNFSLVFNGSGSGVAYDSGWLAAGAGDLWIDGALAVDDFAIRDGASTTAWAIKVLGTGNTSETYFFDNITLYNQAIGPGAAVPEPAHYALGLGVLGALAAWRRRHSRTPGMGA